MSLDTLLDPGRGGRSFGRPRRRIGGVAFDDDEEERRREYPPLGEFLETTPLGRRVGQLAQGPLELLDRLTDVGLAPFALPGLVLSGRLGPLGETVASEIDRSDIPAPLKPFAAGLLGVIAAGQEARQRIGKVAEEEERAGRGFRVGGGTLLPPEMREARVHPLRAIELVSPLAPGASAGARAIQVGRAAAAFRPPAAAIAESARIARQAVEAEAQAAARVRELGAFGQVAERPGGARAETYRAAATEAAPAAPRAEGRQAIVFTDTVRSTEAARGLRAADVDRYQTEQRRVFIEAGTKHGGRLVGERGDGAVWVFPSADDAAAALSEAQRALPPGASQVRAGIHVGDFPAARTGGVQGLEVNRAARVMGEARPGGISLSADAAREVGAPVVPLGRRALRGIGEEDIFEIDLGQVSAWAAQREALRAGRAYPAGAQRIGIAGGRLGALRAGATTEEVMRAWPDFPDILRSAGLDPAGHAVQAFRSTGGWSGEQGLVVEPSLDLVLRTASPAQAQYVAGRLGLSASTFDPVTGAPQNEVWVWRFGDGPERVANFVVRAPNGSPLDDASLRQVQEVLVGETGGFTTRMSPSGRARSIEISTDGHDIGAFEARIEHVADELRSLGYGVTLQVDPARLSKLVGSVEYERAVAEGTLGLPARGGEAGGRALAGAAGGVSGAEARGAGLLAAGGADPYLAHARARPDLAERLSRLATLGGYPDGAAAVASDLQRKAFQVQESAALSRDLGRLTPSEQRFLALRWGQPDPWRHHDGNGLRVSLVSEMETLERRLGRGLTQPERNYISRTFGVAPPQATIARLAEDVERFVREEAGRARVGAALGVPLKHPAPGEAVIAFDKANAKNLIPAESYGRVAARWNMLPSGPARGESAGWLMPDGTVYALFADMGHNVPLSRAGLDWGDAAKANMVRLVGDQFEISKGNRLTGAQRDALQTMGIRDGEVTDLDTGESLVYRFLREDMGMARLDLGLGPVFHHISPFDFGEFKTGSAVRAFRSVTKPGKGVRVGELPGAPVVFFTQSRRLAREVAIAKAHMVNQKQLRVYEAELNAKRVLRLDRMKDEELRDFWLRILSRTGLSNKAEDTQRMYRSLAENAPLSVWRQYQFSLFDDPPVVDELRREGFDAAAFPDAGEGRSVVVFDPQQIENLRVHVKPARETDRPVITDRTMDAVAHLVRLDMNGVGLDEARKVIEWQYGRDVAVRAMEDFYGKRTRHEVRGLGRFGREEAGEAPLGGAPTFGLGGRLFAAPPLDPWDELDDAGRMTAWRAAAVRIVELSRQGRPVSPRTRGEVYEGGQPRQFATQTQRLVPGPAGTEVFDPRFQRLTEQGERLAPEIEPRVAPVSWGATELAAAMLGRPAREVAAGMLRRGVTTAEVEMVSTEVARLMTRVEETARRIHIDPLAVSDADRLQAVRWMREADELRLSLEETASELGRGLNILRKRVNEELARAPNDREIRHLIGKLIGTSDHSKVDDLLLQFLAVRGDARATYQLMRDLRKATFWDKAFEYSQANILWAPATHITNTVSGVVQTALLASKFVVKPAIEAGFQAATLGRYVPETTFRDTIPFVQGLMKGYLLAGKRIPDIITGIDEIAPKYGGEMLIPGGAIKGRKGEIIRTPFKLLTIEDAFQTVPMYNALRRVEIERVARRAHPKDPDARALLRETLERDITPERISAGAVSTDGLAIHRAAWHQAEEFALHNRGPALHALNDLRRRAPGLRYLIRFINTPYNLAKLGMRHTPVGLARLPFERIGVIPRQTKVADAIQEAAVGGAVMWWAFSMMESDNATGLWPTDRSERDMWQAENRGPLMVKVGDRWVTALVLGPLLFPYMLAAAVRQVHSAAGSEPSDQQVGEVLGWAGRNFADQVPMLQGFRQVNDLLDAPLGDRAVNILANVATSFVPAVSLLRTAERLMDDYARRPQGIAASIQAAIPVLAEGVPTFNLPAVTPQRDLFGRPVPGSTGAAALFPRSLEERPEPIIQEWRKHMEADPDFAGLQRVNDVIGSGSRQVQLDAKQYDRYAELVGTARYRALTRVMASKQYREADGPGQRKMLRDAKETADRSGRVSFGIERAYTPNAPPAETAVGVRIAMDASLTATDKALVLDDIEKRGFLSAEVQAIVDTQGHDLSVSDYRRGLGLRRAYDAVPAYRDAMVQAIRERDGLDWRVVEASAKQYRELIDQAEKRGVRQPWNTDETLKRFYRTTNGGWLTRLYSIDGDIKNAEQHPTRERIEKDPLWSKFRSGSRRAP